MKTKLERLAPDLVWLRLRLFALAVEREQLGPAASARVIGRPTSPGLVAVAKAGKLARAKVAEIKADQYDTKAAFTTLWGEWTDEIEYFHEDTPSSMWLEPYWDKWDYWLDPYFEALKAEQKTVARRVGMARAKNNENNNALLRLEHILAHRDKERKYIIPLVQQAYIPAEY